MEGLDFTPKPSLKKPMNIAAIVVSILVLLLVGLMRRPEYKIHTEIDFSFLAPLHAGINALTAIVLFFAIKYAREKKFNLHRKLINLALVLSALFLTSYVMYHFTTEETKYCGVGTIRYFYFFLLITHVVLAGAILPFILITYTRAYTGRFAIHKKMARWIGPLWLYVAVTGPIVYLMLRPCFS